MTLTIGYRRSDGKWPVTLSFAGAPNMFGGFYPSSSNYRKLFTPEKLLETVQQSGTAEQKARYTAAHCGVPVPEPLQKAA